MNKANTLFLSYDGMTDALGQSQVLPYLIGLSASYTITMISFEKADKFEDNKKTIQQLIKPHNIEWTPLQYTKQPLILSTIYDIIKLKKIVFKIIKEKNIQLVHCRSYITALVGLNAKQQLGTKFIFDMRGFWADERVDGKLWNLKNPIYKKVYHYFKQKEIEFLKHADYTISLTHNAKNEILSWNVFKNNPIPIQVIPCCVDMNLFDPTKINEATKQHWRQQLNIHTNDIVLTYLGSVGTWYLLDEMMAFFLFFQEQFPKAKFLFINKEEKDRILNSAKKYNLEDKVIIQSANRTEVPELLSLSKLSVFFIMPTYSKKASSPTKQGEIMAMEIPLICNANVGDTDFVVEKYHSGIVINDLKDFSKLKEDLNRITTINDLAYLRTGCKDYFSLENGINNYSKVYSTVLS